MFLKKGYYLKTTIKFRNVIDFLYKIETPAVYHFLKIQNIDLGDKYTCRVSLKIISHTF